MDNNEEVKYTCVCTVCGKQFETASPLRDVCDDCVIEINRSLSPEYNREKEWYEYFD